MGAVDHKVTLDYRLPYNQVFQAFVQAIQAGKFTLTNQDPSRGVINCKTGVTWKSWGELIDITMGVTPQGITKVDVWSHPAMPTTLIDFGRNRKLVEQLVQSANAYMGIR